MNDFVSCFVLKDQNNNIVDIISYYKQKTKALKNNEIINKACLFYYTSNSLTKYLIGKLLLSIAKTENMDVLCATDVMDNIDVIENNKFIQNNSMLYFYLYNWDHNTVKSNNIDANVF